MYLTVYVAITNNVARYIQRRYTQEYEAPEIVSAIVPRCEYPYYLKYTILETPLGFE